jgi:hypothetical protein
MYRLFSRITKGLDHIADCFKEHVFMSMCPCPRVHVHAQTDDLARMYRLFSRITKGLDPIADCFKEHVESEGMKLVKQVAEAVEAKKEKDVGTLCVVCCVG